MTNDRIKSVLLRIPRDLWLELNAWAQDELRSLNGQLEYILREAARKRRKGEKNTGADEP